jgi:gluconate kinase
VLACSVLKERYHQQLLDSNAGVQIMYLKGSYDLIWLRMEKRTDHANLFNGHSEKINLHVVRVHLTKQKEPN